MTDTYWPTLRLGGTDMELTGVVFGAWAIGAGTGPASPPLAALPRH
jgi:hypothetical protein